MENLTSDTVLQRVPNLTIELESNNEVFIYNEGQRVSGGSHSLAVLDTFSRPTSLAEGLSHLRQRTVGAVDWVDLTSTITLLYKAGILHDGRQAKPALNKKGRGFDSAVAQVPMLNDRARTSSYLKAIGEVVRRGDVVVDLGTGTGVLAIAAARAGARHVYAIEATSMGRVASMLFEANGLADRITLVQGWSTQVTLPERADMLVSEIIGNDPLGEKVLEITADAVKRLVKHDARLVPGRLRIFGLPVAIPRAVLKGKTFTAEVLRDWRSWYGIDFDPLAEAARSSPHVFYIKPSQARGWRTLGEPSLLADLQLKAADQFSVDSAAEFVVTKAGRLNGVLIFFELELSSSTRLSTHPAKADRACNWRSPAWVINPLSVRPGQRLVISYKNVVGEARHSVSVSRM